jgi:glutathione synthase/RimK-type ligase-like ATP-grasp enzyme
MRRLVFATNTEWADLTPDDQLGAAALRARGVDVRPGIWDDPSVDWPNCDAVVFRSPWEYHRRIDAFRAWLDRLDQAGVRTINPMPTLRWNLHKFYLRELEEAGVRLIPTAFVECGARASLAALLAERGWREVVVKPAISAGANETWRVAAPVSPEDDARFQRDARCRDTLVQQFATPILTEGEWSLLFFGGRFSHAVVKRPAAGDFRVQWYYGGAFEGVAPGAALIEQAERVLAAAPVEHTYARVDGVVIDGRFALMELELLEPALWLGADPAAPGRFAGAVLASLDGPPRCACGAGRAPVPDH